MPRNAPATRPAKHTISYQLREIIEARGLCGHAVARLAGLDEAVVRRFLSGRCAPRLDTVDRIAEALGLRLVEVAARARPRR